MKLRVEVGDRYHLQNTVCLMIEDSGEGIPAEKHDKLFAKFQESLDLLNQGTGIGLCLCKHLVDAMGGEIWLDKSYDSGIEGSRGTRFVVDLKTPPYAPSISSIVNVKNRESITLTSIHADSSWHKAAQSVRLEATDSTKDQASHDGTAASCSSNQLQDHNGNDSQDSLQEDNSSFSPLPEEMSVLFVDDDMILRKLFRRSLKMALPGWKVQEAANGETAIRMADAELFDIIFMDQYMSSTEKQLLGTEAIRELRAKGVKSKICGLSANEMEDAFLNAGADAFMLKPMPCDKEELLKDLEKLIYC